MKSEFEIAITQLSADRNLAPDVIIEAIEMALVSAYKRNYGPSQNVKVELDRRTGKARVYVKKQVVEEIEDERNEITPAEARLLDPAAALGDFVDVEVMPRDFGRIAAQTAKQVITQRIREAERDSVYAEYAERAEELVNGIVREVDVRTRTVGVSLGKAEAVLPRSEQIAREHYRVGQRIRVYIVSVERTARGPQITVSRTHPDLLRRLLELEVPEIYNGTVEVKAIAREPGYRSKVAVAALQSGVDPVGSCVGMRGVRIQNIVNELAGEKIDVVEWSRDEQVFIANALSPAKVTEVYLNRDEKAAKVIVPDRALSLAIGKEGQNARLAAKLTGWRIDIKSESEAAEEAEQLAAEMEAAAERDRERQEARLAAAALLAEAEAAMLEEEDDEDLLEQETSAEAPVEMPEIVDEHTLAEESEPEAVEATEPEPEDTLKAEELVEPEAELEALETETPEAETPEFEATEPEAAAAAAAAGAAEEPGVAEEAEVEAAEDADAEDAIEDAVAETAVAETAAEDETSEAEAAESDVAEDAESWDQEPESEQEILATEMASKVDRDEREMPEEESDELSFELEEDLPDYDEDDDEDDDSSRGGDRGRRRRDRRFVYDERLGRVVARKRHKRSGNRDWDEDYDE